MVWTFFFFFSSRRRHTRYWRDWSSDVCSSDLPLSQPPRIQALHVTICHFWRAGLHRSWRQRWPVSAVRSTVRSEERRVGKSVDLGGRRIIKKKKCRYLLSRYTTIILHHSSHIP